MTMMRRKRRARDGKGKENKMTTMMMVRVRGCNVCLLT